MCLELLEEEPNCKWAILTAALLTNACVHDKIMEHDDARVKLESYFVRLRALDPMRNHYYDDFEQRLLANTGDLRKKI